MPATLGAGESLLGSSPHGSVRASLEDRSSGYLLLYHSFTRDAWLARRLASIAQSTQDNAHAAMSAQP